MPREIRKRGKKHKKAPLEGAEFKEESGHIKPPPQEEPSWIVPAPTKTEEVNPDAPFGYVDVDVKAYFRTVDIQIRDWQGPTEAEEDLDTDVDPNEQKRLFFVAALTEMHGKEKQLATDPDCSVILERMLYSMDDFVRRVFADSLAGSYNVLSRNRFASHVCQTLFTVAKHTISRETKKIVPKVPESQDKGELRTMVQLILDICEELLPTISSLFDDPYASHVIRSLLLLLCPALPESEDSVKSKVRSKKSAAWKARQGVMKSFFSEGKGEGKETISNFKIPEFQKLACRIIDTVRKELGDNEVRAMAANKVSCPGLQVLLEVEAEENMSNEPGSLMDRLMMGVITNCNSSGVIEESDYVGSLLRDPNSSRLLEIIVSRCPDEAFGFLWRLYFKDNLRRLAVHPVANFVVAKALERVSESELAAAFSELAQTLNKLILTSRTGVVRAAIDRASTLKASLNSIPDAVFSAFNVVTPEDKKFLIPCILGVLSLPDYQAALAESKSLEATNDRKGRTYKSTQDPLEPKTQGSVLLQSLLRLPESYNQFIIDSILSMPIEDRIKISRNSSGSRVFDAFLESPTIPAKMKLQLIMDFIGHYHLLVDDKLGSRVGDRCWSFCDIYLKEKIARSLISHEQTLAGSFYGKFFARNLNLYLLQRRPEEWRNLQLDRKRAKENDQPSSIPVRVVKTAPGHETPVDRKRKSQHDNEIDALFDEKLGKKVKRAAIVDDHSKPEGEFHEVSKFDTTDKELMDVLGAIRSAPSGEFHSKKKNR